MKTSEKSDGVAVRLAHAVGAAIDDFDELADAAVDEGDQAAHVVALRVAHALRREKRRGLPAAPLQADMFPGEVVGPLPPKKERKPRGPRKPKAAKVDASDFGPAVTFDESELERMTAPNGGAS